MSLQVSYVGGPVSLGCLYDARNERFLTGTKLWTQDTTRKMIVTTPKPSQFLSIDAESTFSNKAKRLDISASLKLSILSGLIELEGSGKYLNDTKSSINSESLTVVYNILTELQELHLGPEIEFPKFLDDPEATHIVTGIQFGARAFLVFERERQENESNTDISGSFKGTISKFKALFEVSGQISAQFDDKDAETTEKIKCRYYGDFALEPPPMTLKEALNCVKNFTSEKAKSPIQVYLTPLSKLGGKPQALIKSISDEYLNAAGEYCQLLNDFISAATARIKMMESTPWRVQQKLLCDFVAQVQLHKSRYTDALLEILPKLRETGGHGDDLGKVVTKFRDESPFSPLQLEAWLVSKERECIALQCIADLLVSAGASVLTDVTQKDQIGIMKTSGQLLIEVSLPKSQYIEDCKLFIDSKFPSRESNASETWMDSESFSVFQLQLHRLTLFLRLNPGTAAALLSSSSGDSQSLGLQTKCVKDHKWVAVEVPSPPDELKCVSTKSTEAEFCWTPVTGSFVQYRVTVFKVKGEESIEFRQDRSKQEKMVISKLDPGSNYEAQVATETQIGVSEPSKPIAFSTRPPLSCSEYVRVNWCGSMPLARQAGEEFPGQIFRLKKVQKMLPERCTCKSDCCICPMSFEVGENRQSLKPPKVVLVVGETGTGKSTFINGIANAFYKVEYSDTFRFKLVAEPEGKAAAGEANQALSQTSIVSIYTLFPVNTGGEDDSCRSAMICPLTIIDTPGFGNTRGLAEDERIVKKISKVLGEDGASIPGMTGVLHAIGFVVKASQYRLTIRQKYIFDQVLSLFGKDVEQIILPILTFADGNEPQALAALKEDKVPHENFLKFNNGMLYADNSDVTSAKQASGMSANEKKRLEIKLKVNEMDWESGEVYYLELFEAVEKCKNGISLQSTRDVLKSRRTLELSMERLMIQVRSGIAALTSLEQNLDLIDIWDRDAKKQLIESLLGDFEKASTEFLLSDDWVMIHWCLQSLEQLALRQYPLSVAEYVDHLIKVQESEKKPGWENRVKHLTDAKESATIFAAARVGQDPFGEKKEVILARCKKSLEDQMKAKGT